MATSFSSVKTNIPGVGWRVYVFSQYRMQGGACTPNPNNVSRQCMYLAGAGNQNDTWGPGQPFEGLFPNVGEFISADVGTYIQCYKVLEIIDEATFNTGTCVSCYNNGFQGNCSDAFVTTPPYPGDPNGCLYNNSINNAGIVPASFPVGSQAFSYIQNDCRNCTTGSPPVFEPNMIVNCCDPSERYVLDPTAPSPFSSIPPIYDQLTVPYTTSTLGVGIVNYQEAFAAGLYIDGGIGWLTSPPTPPKCWHLVNDPTPFGPTALSASIMNIGKRPSCAELNTVWLASNPIGVDTACCTQEVQIDCETPFAKLEKLTSKLDKFTTWKNKSLGK